MEKYDHKKIEKKWQEKWEKDGVYKTASNDKPKQYILDMFPYPSGEGLHVGHPRGYIATDVYSRKKRMEGYDVLHPMGWDAFGLPAENFAIKHQVHPRVAVEKNVARFKEQLSLIGLDYDWSREINTTDPAFYKWTQWTFLQMLKKGLAYESHEPVNWCPTDKTVLANEDVEPDGTCERCGAKVEKRPMRQWVLKITDYADRLLADLDKLPKWPEGVKEAQRNWIGRTEGAEIDFPIEGQPEHPIKIFTTRPDTMFGATFVGVSAGLAKDWVGVGWNPSQEVKDYIEQTLQEEAVRDFKEKEKTGIYAGFDAINPASKEKVPVWITNYVMKDVGTGAIMGVPAHDERDFDFAKKYELPIKEVISCYYEGLGDNAPKENTETLDREVIDIIIENEKGEFLLIKETANNTEKIHFVGGGTEGEDEIEALKKELQEETGYVDFEIMEKIPNLVSAFAFRHTKLKNQRTHGYFFHIKLKSEKRVTSEVEEGKHSLLWVPKEKIKDLINWPHHLYAWEMFLKKDRVFSNLGILVNSDQFDGLTSEEAKQKITEFVGGKMVSTYRIKDWVFSRQRYWGEPIPIIHCEKCGVVPVPEDQLPVLLPDVSKYEPTGTGESPLADIPEWVNTSCPTCGGSAKRETNTMPQWAGSSWYYLRYIDPTNSKALIDPEKEKKWMPVDVYVGGDHATRHLIYARFWHKFLFDIEVVSQEEPFPRLEFLGFILAEDGRKMSKRWGNIINPDDVINTFGADAFRLYEMFIGPFENTTVWNMNGLVGTYRFLERVWRLQAKVDKDKKICRTDGLVHKTVKAVAEDIEQFKFNTAISKMMILLNALEKEEKIVLGSYKILLKLLAPFAPHITEELWHELSGLSTSGEQVDSIHLTSWPEYNETKIVEENINVAVQVNGRVRAEIVFSADASEDEIKSKAMEHEMVKKWTEGKVVKRVVYVKGRLVNIVAS